MPLLGLAVGTIAASGAVRAYSYNRCAWMNNVQVNQVRRHQRQVVHIHQADMFREDIRDLASRPVIEMSNYILVNTLVLAIAVEAFIEGPLPDGSAQFLFSAYGLCLGSALLYLLMSLLCAFRALSLAANCQQDLLTTLVRLPVVDILSDLKGAASSESVEAFERQGLSKMLRVPFVSSLGSDVEHSEDRSDLPAHDAPTKVIASEESSRLHADVFQVRELVFEALGKWAFVFGALGVSHLAQAFGYFSVAKYTDGHSFANWFVQVLLILVDGLLARMSMDDLPRLAVWYAWVSMMGPTLCLVAILCADSVLGLVLIPLGFLCHAAVSFFGMFQLWSVLQAALQKPLPELGARTFDEAARASNEVRVPRSDDGETRPAEAQGPLDHPIDKEPLKRVYLASVFVALAWLISGCWVFHHGPGDPGDGLLAGPRRLRRCGFGFAVPLAQDAVSEIEVEWPNPLFSVNAVACSDGGRCFVASTFSVLELLPPDGSETAWSTEIVPCRVEGEILDLAASCHTSGCFVHLLVRGRDSQSNVHTRCDVDGDQPPATAGEMPGSEAAHVTLGDRGEMSLLVADASEVTEYGVLHSERSRALLGGRHTQRKMTPLQRVAAVDAPQDLVAIDLAPSNTSGSSILAFFRAEGAIQVKMVGAKRERRCRAWTFASELDGHRVHSGAILRPDSVMVLVSSLTSDAVGLEHMRVFTVRLPEAIGARCG